MYTKIIADKLYLEDLYQLTHNKSKICNFWASLKDSMLETKDPSIVHVYRKLLELGDQSIDKDICIQVNEDNFIAAVKTGRLLDALYIGSTLLNRDLITLSETKIILIMKNLMKDLVLSGQVMQFIDIVEEIIDISGDKEISDYYINLLIQLKLHKMSSPREMLSLDERAAFNIARISSSIAYLLNRDTTHYMGVDGRIFSNQELKGLEIDMSMQILDSLYKAGNMMEATYIVNTIVRAHLNSWDNDSVDIPEDFLNIARELLEDFAYQNTKNSFFGESARMFSVLVQIESSKEKHEQYLIQLNSNLKKILDNNPCNVIDLVHTMEAIKVVSEYFCGK